MGTAFIFIALFASVFGIFYIFFTTRNRERLIMIEQGIDLSKSKEPKALKQPRTYTRIKFSLKLGMFLIGIGLGFVIAILLDQMFMIDQIEMFVIGVVFVFGGLGLVGGYLIGCNIEKKEE